MEDIMAFQKIGVGVIGCEGDSEFYHYALGKPVIRWLDAWRWEEV